MYDLTGSTLQVGLLGVGELIPFLTVPIVGGAIADVVDRRRVMLVSATIALVASALYMANAALPHPRSWALYPITLLAVTGYAAMIPAERSLVPALVGVERIAAASALESIYRNFAAVAGPALGGVAVATLGFRTTYAIDVATFAAALWAILLLPPALPAEAEDRVTLRSIVDGLRYIPTRRELLGIFLVDTNAMIFGMPMALFPAIGDRLGGPSVVGLLYAAPSAGALVAAFFSGTVTRMRRQGVGVLIAAALWGVAIVVFGFTESLWLALFFLALAGAADFVSAVLRSAIALAATPDAMRGRVTGIEFTQVTSAPTLGNLEAGALASLTSVRFSVVSGGVACVVGTILLAAAIPELVRYDAREVTEAA
jgi:MFS family permease